MGLHLLAHVLLSEVHDALFCLDLLLLCHALEGFLTVLVHVDGELVDEVFGLYVGSIIVKHVAVALEYWILEILLRRQWRHLEIVEGIHILKA